MLDPHSSPALYKMLGHDRGDEVYTEPYDIKAAVQTAVAELIDEINNLYRNIADQVSSMRGMTGSVLTRVHPPVHPTYPQQ